MSTAQETAMVRVVSEGDSKYRLEGPSGSDLGWIRGRAVGVTGFKSEREALGAALSLRRTVDESLRRFEDSPRQELAPKPVRLVHDGAYEWLAAGNVPIARLHRPGTRVSPDDAYALEFVLPSRIPESVALMVAQVLADRTQGAIGPDAYVRPSDVTASPQVG
jgi:hypothetical protein